MSDYTQLPEQLFEAYEIAGDVGWKISPRKPRMQEDLVQIVGIDPKTLSTNELRIESSSIYIKARLMTKSLTPKEKEVLRKLSEYKASKNPREKAYLEAQISKLPQTPRVAKQVQRFIKPEELALEARTEVPF